MDPHLEISRMGPGVLLSMRSEKLPNMKANRDSEICMALISHFSHKENETLREVGS